MLLCLFCVVGEDYAALFKNGTYGVVTGWGYRCQNRDPRCEPFEVMKQIQMQIQDENAFKANVDIPTVPENFPMFCAGGQGNIYVFWINCSKI